MFARATVFAVAAVCIASCGNGNKGAAGANSDSAVDTESQLHDVDAAPAQVCTPVCGVGQHCEGTICVNDDPSSGCSSSSSGIPCGHGTCIDDSPNDYHCECDVGYYESGSTCLSCSPLVGCDDWVCTNPTDSLCIQCSMGYTDNGLGACQEVGDCLTRPCGNGDCVETGERYRCDCPSGEYDNGTTCVSCLERQHCAEVICTAADDSICARCESGFLLDADGTCADIDDCAPNPCASGGCADLGANAYDCIAAFNGHLGGDASVVTTVGTVSATASPDSFLDSTGGLMMGDVYLEATPDGFSWTYETLSGGAFAPELMLDITFEDAFGNPLAVDPGKSITITLPLPPTSGHLPGESILLYYYDVVRARWIVESTGTVVSEASGRGARAAASHFTWFAVGATCAPIAGCALVSCGTSRCDRCQPGYTLEADGSCRNINDCVTHQCGAGVCVDGVEGYTCACPVGTYGDGTSSCSTCAPSAVAACVSVVCTGPATSTCTACEAGYTLANGRCQDIDDCGSKPCGLGSCTDSGANAYTCDCPDGTFGDGTRSCQSCAPVPGCTAVSCTSDALSTCTACSPGFRLNVGKCGDIDECAGNTNCAVGKCIDGINTFTCDCPDGTFGDGTKSCTACSPSLSAGCTAVTCARAGTSSCVACSSGFTLISGNCQNTNDCIGAPCGAGGTCLDGVNSFTCDCIDGYFGDGSPSCTACSPSASLGCTAVSCTGPGSSTCSACTAGFTLVSGSCVDIDDCASNPCDPGRCSDIGTNAWTCDCPNGTYGDGTTSCSDCEPIAGCTALMCSGPDSSTCSVCATGYTLSAGKCNNIDDCPGNTCGAGTCVDGINNHTCNCPEGMFGDGTKTCTVCDAVVNCATVSCTSASNETCATCLMGYEPDGSGGCQDHNDCSPDPCNGGACTDTGVNSYDCSACPAGTFHNGVTCADCEVIANCYAAVCNSSSNSTCVTCTAGFDTDGSGGCQDHDDCQPNPCGNSSCLDTGALTYVCVGCQSGLDCTAERPVCTTTDSGTKCRDGINECTGDDEQEHHDDGPMGANVISLGTPMAARICGDNGSASAAEFDWYSLTLLVTTHVEVTLTWTDADIDLDFYLLDSELQTLSTAGATASARPEIGRVVALPPGMYYVLVSSYAGASSAATPYDLHVDSFTPECTQNADCTADALPACDTVRFECVACLIHFDCPPSAPFCSHAGVAPACTVVDTCLHDDANEHSDDGPNGSTAVPLAGGANVSGKICGDPSADSSAEGDWFRITLGPGAKSSVGVTLQWTEEAVDLDLVLLDSDGTIIQGAESTANPEEMTVIDAEPGDYLLYVNAYAGAPVEAIDYTLAFNPYLLFVDPETGNVSVNTAKGGSLQFDQGDSVIRWNSPDGSIESSEPIDAVVYEHPRFNDALIDIAKGAEGQLSAPPQSQTAAVRILSSMDACGDFPQKYHGDQECTGAPEVCFGTCDVHPCCLVHDQCYYEIPQSECIEGGLDSKWACDSQLGACAGASPGCELCGFAYKYATWFGGGPTWYDADGGDNYCGKSKEQKYCTDLRVNRVCDYLYPLDWSCECDVCNKEIKECPLGWEFCDFANGGCFPKAEFDCSSHIPCDIAPYSGVVCPVGKQAQCGANVFGCTSGSHPYFVDCAEEMSCPHWVPSAKPWGPNVGWSLPIDCTTIAQCPGVGCWGCEDPSNHIDCQSLNCFPND